MHVKRIYLYWGLLGLIALLAGIGMYKFNYLQDDIYYQGNAIGPGDATMFYGAWVEPNPIRPDAVQGFVLKPNGKARSIHMETLKYRSWWLEPGQLVLVAESIGNGISFVDTTAYPIELLGSNELRLKMAGGVLCFQKDKRFLKAE